jgi:hypothetical protein
MNFIRRISSRKFIVFAIGTFALFFGKLNNTWEWILIAAIFVGSNTLDKLLFYKNNKKEA